MLKPILAAVALMSSGVMLIAPAHAEKPQIYTAKSSSLAVGGYDAVSYFSGTPVKGVADFSTEYKGATWLFSSAENLAAFTADQDKFAPQYGGYCAWAAAQGKTAKGDPAIWKIVDGKLYLNFDKNVQKRWEADIPGFIKKADANWPGILAD